MDRELKEDGYTTALAIVQSKGCSDIDRVITTTISPLADPMSLLATERWVLHGCGRTYPFLVNVSADGEGRTYIDVHSDL